MSSNGRQQKLQNVLANPHNPLNIQAPDTGCVRNTGEKTFSASFEPQPNKKYHVFSIILKLYVPIFKVENEKRL